MGVLKGLLWFLFATGVIAIAMYLTGNYELADRLTALFVAWQPYLPLKLDFDLFLVVTTVLSLLLGGVALGGCAFMLAFMTSRLTVAQRQQLAQAAASQQEITHIKEQQQRQHQQLITFAQSFTKRLDKRVLVQGIVEAACRVTSSAQANSIVSLWLLQFGTDIMHFEHGLYCEQSLFTQADYPATDALFARVIQSQQPSLLPQWSDGVAVVQPEKAPTLRATSGGMLVPLVVEGAVLGVLVIFCHPDVLKSYTEQKMYFNAIWQELSLALAVAVQGELAIFDRLTGAHNREYFMKRLIQEIDRANRFQFPLTLLMADVDNFKAVNDTLGHPQGDAVLKIIAKLIRQEVRAIDLVGRYGGEEFVVLLPETGMGEEGGGASGAMVVAERIRKAVDQEFAGLQKPLNLTVSLGVAIRRFPEDRTMDQRELIRLADEQLYRAKATGKNKVCVEAPAKSPQVP
ncbi:MAG: GGDEF domain-containing protein [Candidatus Omnitrophica bacterium]|nr:GGDEF domain-containing protein [Candidatus Omnitrophota bacterium]